jgi:Tol biopolymer transport system component
VVYRVSPGRSKLTLTDRAGREQTVLPGSVPWEPRFSPDGRRIAYAASGRGPDLGDVWAGDVWPNDVWIADLASAATERITTDGNDNNEPTWTRDGTALAYSSARLPDAKDIFLQTLDGARTRRIVGRPGLQFPFDFTADGRTLLFGDEPPGGTLDIWIQPLDGAAARPYLATRAHEYDARISPDGRWVAYASDETGRSEVYLQPYPIPGRRVVVTTSGGERPVWQRDGRALYYWQGDQLIVASLDARPGERPAVRNRTVLFRAPRADPGKGYDVTVDGSRIAMIIGAPRANRLIVALDALGDVHPAKRADP